MKNVERGSTFPERSIAKSLGTRLMFGGSGAQCGAHAEDCLSAKPAVDSRRARVPQASGGRI